MEERRNEILKELDRKGRVKVTDLSKIRLLRGNDKKKTSKRWI